MVFRNRILGRREKSALKSTPGEQIRDAIFNSSLKVAEESAYAAGNLTEKYANIASSAETVVNRGTELAGGIESARSLGKIAFKNTKDIARGDTVCTGLCLISGTCEIIALGCSTIKIIPFRGRVYVVVKIVSAGCMTYRNLCVGEGC